MITIEDIKNDLEKFVNSHPQLQDFGFGNIDNISTKNHKFPMLWMQLTPGEYNNNHELIRADIYIMDVLEHDLSNEVKLFSDTSIYTNDLIGYLIDDVNGMGYGITKTGVVKEPFSAKFDDHCSGFIFEIELQVPINYCTNNTPITLD